MLRWLFTCLVALHLALSTALAHTPPAPRNDVANATLSSGISSAVTGRDFREAFGSSFVRTVVALGLADAQNEIGGLFKKGADGGEGSLGHIVLHGIAGCAAAELQGADCAAGAAGGIAQGIYAGRIAGSEPVIEDYETEEQYQAAYASWSDDASAAVAVIGSLAGYVLSGGDGENVSLASAVAVSGLQNNYLEHTQRAKVDELLEEYAENCFGDAADPTICTGIELEIQEFEQISINNTQKMRDACRADPNGAACQDHFKKATEYLAWAKDARARFDVGVGLFYHEDLESQGGGSLDEIMVEALRSASFDNGEEFDIAIDEAIEDDLVLWGDDRLRAAGNALKVLEEPDYDLQNDCPPELGACFTTAHEKARADLRGVGIVDFFVPMTPEGLAIEAVLLATAGKLVKIGGRLFTRADDKVLEIATNSGALPDRRIEIAELFDNSNPRNGIQIGDRTVLHDGSAGGARVFSGVSDTEVRSYFGELTGQAMPSSPTRVLSDGREIYTVTTPDGNFNLRNFSSSGTGRWTIDIPAQAGGGTRRELKFE